MTTYAGLITVPAATTVYRVDILPTMNIFPVDTTLTRFMTYKVTKVSYELLPRFNISSMPGTLPVIYTVPVQSHLLPAASVAAFTAYAACKTQLLHSTHRGAFSPMMYQDNA